MDSDDEAKMWMVWHIYFNHLRNAVYNFLGQIYGKDAEWEVIDCDLKGRKFTAIIDVPYPFPMKHCLLLGRSGFKVLWKDGYFIWEFELKEE